MGALPSTRHSSGSQLHWHSWLIDGTCPYVQIQLLGDLYIAHLQDEHALLQMAAVTPLGQASHLQSLLDEVSKLHHSRIVLKIVAMDWPTTFKVRITMHCCTQASSLAAHTIFDMIV